MDYISESSRKIVSSQSELCKAMESVLGKDFLTMTDKEIGKTAREIAERGNTAEIKRNKDGILIIEVEKKIVRKDNVSSNQKL